MFTSRYALMGGACLLAFTMQAEAQPKPQQTDQVMPVRIATYNAGVLGFTPVASATDIFTITGSATAVVRVKSISCTGTSTTVGAVPVALIKRSTANAGGTLTARTATPNDSNAAAATAVVNSYTANATSLGTVVGSVVAIGVLYTNLTGTSTFDAHSQGWDFGLHNDQEVVLRGVAQTLAVNAGGTSFPAGSSLSCAVEWTESGN